LAGVTIHGVKPTRGLTRASGRNLPGREMSGASYKPTQRQASDFFRAQYNYNWEEKVTNTTSAMYARLCYRIAEEMKESYGMSSKGRR
jgi:hypothetical protein